MPLISAKDFPMDVQPHGNAITQALQAIIAPVMKQKQVNSLLKAQTFQKQAKTDAAQLARVRNMTDPQAQRREIAILGQNAITEGRDPAVFMDVLNAQTPDMLNLALSRGITKMSDADTQIAEAMKKVEPQSPQGKVQADVQAGFLTPEQAVANKDKLTSIQQNLIGAGFVPGTQKFQSKLLELIEKPTGTTVNVGTGGFKVPAGFMINPDDPSGQSVVPIPGSKGGTLSGEGAKLSEIARGGLEAVESLVTGFESGNITQETMAAATAVPDMFNFFKSAPVQEYETVATNLTDMIGRLRSGGAINSDEEKRFEKLIPKFGDKNSVIKSKLAGLENMFKNIQSKVSLTPINQSIESNPNVLTPEEAEELRLLEAEYGTK